MAAERAPDEIFCRHCGETIKERAELCPNCGVRNSRSVPDESTHVYCQSCGERIKSEAEICPECGVKNGVVSETAADSGSSSDAIRIATTGFGLLFLLAGFGALTEGELSSGAFYLLVGAALLPQVRNRVSVEYSLATVGYVSDTRRRATRNAGLTCVACQRPVDEGVVREYAKRFVLFGVPLYTAERGENAYCRSCANGDVPDRRSASEFATATVSERER